MSDVIKPATTKHCEDGHPGPFGASVFEDGVNFALYSRNAKEVFLFLFDSPESPPTDIIPLKRSEDNWHVLVKGIGPGQLYGYKVDGDYNPSEGLRFNPYKLLLDPYAKAVSGKFQNQDNLIFAYDLNAAERDLAMDQRDNERVVPKAIVIADEFDWGDDAPPNIDLHKLIIYETHVKAFTAAPSSGASNPGTYLGFIDKIPYLQDLGINAVEFMPVHQFFIRNELLEKGLMDFWGYNSIGFFTPEVSYGTRTQLGCEVNEFKTLVKALHKAGIEVILDVVYNHTGEGNELGPTLSLKGMDNPTYYALVNEEGARAPGRFYLNDTGCGNTINAENPVVMGMILDSLRYWKDVMHVDGFRFDLASILARADGAFDHDSPFFTAISNDPVLSKAKMIAEPWDLTTYQVGNFPIGWSEWNGKFRDTARRFLKGDDHQAADMARRVTGSADLYENNGRNPYNSINFITCHDGFTLRDLYTYNEKHNEANLEDNRDGADDNLSWNCGVEGETDDPQVLGLRIRMVKNALCSLFLSAGTPMLLYGDEVMRTQKGNNNTYSQDNELTWFDWEDVKRKMEVYEFCRKIIAFRQSFPVLQRQRFFKGEESDGAPDIEWYGRHLKPPNWNSPKLKLLYYQLCGEKAREDARLLLVFNMYHRGCRIDLPEYADTAWCRIIDTSHAAGKDFIDIDRARPLRKGQKNYCAARSVHVFLGKEAGG